jgi:hypothetical protein
LRGGPAAAAAGGIAVARPRLPAAPLPCSASACAPAAGR